MEVQSYSRKFTPLKIARRAAPHTSHSPENGTPCIYMDARLRGRDEVLVSGAAQIVSGTILMAPQGHSLAQRPQPLQKS